MAIDNCGSISSLTISHDTDTINSSNCANRMVITRTYRATDACGNITTKAQTITVNSTTPPIIANFPVDATFSCPSQVPPANNALVTATDNCGGSVAIAISHDDDALVTRTCTNQYILRRTYRATDACGNVTSKSQLITVSSTVAPTIVSFPQDATYQCASAVPGPSDGVVGAVDQCGGQSTVMISHDADVITSSNCVSKFTITRTYRATDLCGNVITRSQVLTVNATTPPAITGFPADATYGCADSVPVANDGLVTAIDGCSGAAAVALTHLADLVTSSNCVSRFTIQRTYIATDACGNSSSRSQTLTVNGTTPPTITMFPVDASYSCATAVPLADNTLVAATNACSGNSRVVITHGADFVTSSNCVNRFTIARTYTATDACGNFSTKTQTIAVNGTIAPTISTFPVDVTYLVRRRSAWRGQCLGRCR